MRQSRSWLLLFLITLLCDMPLYASHDQLSQQRMELEKTRKYLQKLVDQQRLDGVSIGVINDSGLAWFKSFGYSNREKKIHVSEKTLFRVGSLSKLLTASAILQLEDQEIIDIDQAVSAYIPRFYYKTRFSDPGVITARHLLSHLSGLPTDINKGLWSEERFSDIGERLRTEYTSYPVDFITNYSNIGYSLLGMIIEENTDYLFEEYMQKHFFDPLDMHHSNFNPYGSTETTAATGYNKHHPQPNLPMRDLPAMGLNTSLQEFSHFIQALLNDGRYHDRQILSQDSIAEMFTIQNADVALDFDNHIGIPWFLSRSGDQQVLIAEHSGTTINFSSQVTLAPDKNLAIVIFSNTSHVNPLLKITARSLLNRLINNHHNTTPGAIPQQRTPTARRPSQVLEPHQYIARSGIIELDKNAAKLCECQSKKTLDLVPLPDGWFGLSPRDDGFSSKITEQKVDGKEVIVLEKDGQKHRVGARYKPADNRFNWDKYFGDYEIINPDQGFPVNDVRVFNEDNMMYICYRMPKLSDKLVVLPITPVSDTEAITEGLGRSKGETVYSQHIDGDDLLIYSGYIARKKSLN